MRRPLLFFVLFFLVPCLGRAQNADAPDQAEQIKALLAKANPDWRGLILTAFY